MLQTPVIRYGHRGTGRTVTLVGTVHVVEAGYYKRLHALVADLEAAGAVVCFERVDPAAEHEWAAASGSERAARDAPRALGEQTFRRVCRSLGWVEQGAAFTWAASWRNVDITDLELVRLAGPETVRGLREDLADVFGSSLEQEQADAFAGAAVAVLFRLASLDWFDRLRQVAAWDDASRHFGRVQVEERNARALASLPSGADAVLLWGAGHLPGLAAELAKRGHTRQGTTWVNVGRLPALWPSIKTICKYYRAV